MAAKKTSIGGQALMEGIMMRGPEVTAMAVRTPDGEIVIEEYPTKGKDRSKICRLPIIRGVFGLYDSLSFGYKCLMRSAELSGLEEEENKEKEEKARIKAEKRAAKGKPPKGKAISDSVIFEKILMPIAAVLAVVLAIGLFAYLPALIYSGMSAVIPALEGQYVLRSAVEGVLKILIFVFYVWVTSLQRDIRRVYMYHGGEHKTIFCYEAGLPLTVENVRVQSRFHPRCGTSFMILMLLVSIVIGMFIRIDQLVIRTVVKLLLIPLMVGIGYELIKFAGRKDNALTRAISAPGMWLQRITTREPDDSMIECAIAAMEKVIPEDGTKDNW